jgi:hypothetical protein
VTPDGITTEDWDRVHDLALEVANASGDSDVVASDNASLRLRALLDALQKKYGPLPTLLATRADYVDTGEEREYWLLAAYEQASIRSDVKNLVWVSSSLAALHLENLGDPVKGAQWLARLHEHLQAIPDDSESLEATRLQVLLESLREGPQNKQMQRTRHG